MNPVTLSLWIPNEPNVIIEEGLHDIPHVGFYRKERQVMFWSARKNQLMSFRADFNHNHPHAKLEQQLAKSSETSKAKSEADKDRITEA